MVAEVQKDMTKTTPRRGNNNYMRTLLVSVAQCFSWSWTAISLKLYLFGYWPCDAVHSVDFAITKCPSVGHTDGRDITHKRPLKDGHQ